MLRPTCRKEASRLDPSGKELPGVGGGGSKLYSSTATPASGKLDLLCGYFLYNWLQSTFPSKYSAFFSQRYMKLNQ
ncbi:uncharacterized protein LOC144292809 isoform X3 [Canis aureus]